MCSKLLSSHLDNTLNLVYVGTSLHKQYNDILNMFFYCSHFLFRIVTLFSVVSVTYCNTVPLCFDPQLQLLYSCQQSSSCGIPPPVFGCPRSTSQFRTQTTMREQVQLLFPLLSQSPEVQVQMLRLQNLYGWPCGAYVKGPMGRSEPGQGWVRSG